jgi:hypothetical protein
VPGSIPDSRSFDSSHAIVVGVGNEQVALGIYRASSGKAQFRAGRRSTISAEIAPIGAHPKVKGLLSVASFLVE